MTVTDSESETLTLVANKPAIEWVRPRHRLMGFAVSVSEQSDEEIGPVLDHMARTVTLELLRGDEPLVRGPLQLIPTYPEVWPLQPAWVIPGDLLKVRASYAAGVAVSPHWLERICCVITIKPD